MKDSQVALTEYIKSLSDEDLKFLDMRLSRKFSDDLSEALDHFSKSPGMDEIFAACSSSDELFRLLDLAARIAERESRKRSNR